jgi:hypothetical protein
MKAGEKEAIYRPSSYGEYETEQFQAIRTNKRN